MPTLSILIPVYNEQNLLEAVVEKVLQAPLPEGIERELVLVDDASTDETPRVIERLCRRFPSVKAFRQEKNLGKGGAIQRAIREMSGDFAIFQDADLEYEPNEYTRVLTPLLEEEVDVVYGSRFFHGMRWKDLLIPRMAANRFLTILSNLMTGLRLSDMETCYKAFRADLLRSIPIRSNRFGIEPEITAKIARRQADICEVPISYTGRDYTEGKKIGWKDGVSAVWTILKYTFLNDSVSKESRPVAPIRTRAVPSSAGDRDAPNPTTESRPSSALPKGPTAFGLIRRKGCRCKER